MKFPKSISNHLIIFIVSDMTEVQLRFRSTNGDLGPWLFPESTLVHSLRERLLAEWPTGVFVSVCVLVIL